MVYFEKYINNGKIVAAQIKDDRIALAAYCSIFFRAFYGFVFD